MREIKFRGWHTTQKRMFSAEEMAADQLTLLPTGSFINVHSTSTRLSEIYPRDEFIPLQFTGLCDVRRKEIYEGDIVNGEILEDVIQGSRLSTWDENIVVKWEKYACFNLGDYDQIEIIGNIYENPELLP